MTVGFHPTNLVAKWLNLIRGTNATAPTAIYVQEHIGDPGAAGTANTGAVTTRQAATWAAAAGGAIALNGTLPSFSQTATESISHVSAWDASTAGNVVFTGQLAAARSVQSGDTFTLNTCGISITPLMA